MRWLSIGLMKVLEELLGIRGKERCPLPSLLHSFTIIRIAEILQAFTNSYYLFGKGSGSIAMFGIVNN